LDIRKASINDRWFMVPWNHWDCEKTTWHSCGFMVSQHSQLSPEKHPAVILWFDPWNLCSISHPTHQASLRGTRDGPGLQYRLQVYSVQNHHHFKRHMHWRSTVTALYQLQLGINEMIIP
jgi:hypothetical protein